tara:strand:+ start:108 stop:320 length:213 start_codon:yes stop_codon:yes gene_type:complete
MVKAGFTVLVDGRSFGKIDAAVEAKPPRINREEKINPVPSFLKVFIRKSPDSPIRVNNGKIHSQGVSIKL